MASTSHQLADTGSNEPWTAEDHAVSLPVSKRSRKRRLSSTAQVSLRRSKRIQATRKLEELPNEILQEIFVLSGNPNMALASKRMGQRLSTEHVYIRIMLQVFGNPWDTNSFGNHTPKLVSNILSYRWFTWSTVKKFILFTQSLLESSQAKLELRRCPNKLQALKTLCGTSLGNTTVFDNFIFLRMVPTTTYTCSVSYPLPRRLVGGPWTPDKSTLLEFLCNCTDPGVQWRAHLKQTQIFDGLSEAIKNNNHSLRKCLTNKIVVHGVTAPREALLKVMLDPACDISTMRDLIDDYMVGSIFQPGVLHSETLDPAFLEWATEGEKKGDPKAKELKDPVNVKPIHRAIIVVATPADLTGDMTAVIRSEPPSLAATDQQLSVPQPIPDSQNRTPMAVRAYLSPLERLPNELLQPIFLYSGNHNLAWASNYLGSRLSVERFYLHTMLETLGNPWDPTARCSISDAEVQKLLNCRWFTWPRLKRFIEMTKDLPRNQGDYVWIGTQSSRSNVRKLRILLGQFWNDPDGGYNSLAVFKVTSPLLLPRKLMNGPWTADKVSLLTFLCNVHGPWPVRIDYSSPRTFTGLRDAACEDNVAVMKILMRTELVDGNRVTNVGDEHSRPMREALLDPECSVESATWLITKYISLKYEELDGRTRHRTEPSDTKWRVLNCDHVDHDVHKWANENCESDPKAAEMMKLLSLKPAEWYERVRYWRDGTFEAQDGIGNSLDGKKQLSDSVWTTTYS